MAKKRAQKSAEDLAVPTGDGGKDLIVVGIGASAGGLEAFEQFFTNMPTDLDSGMAFVLVQHLAPDHKSILADLVKRYTSMQVNEVTDGIEVKSNCAYIIPPNRDMALLHGKLHLLQPEAPRGLRLPIDYFFRSLAQDQRERAICIILAGNGSDGTLGMKAIKEVGGIVMVQDPATARYDGMPRSAIATGLVDFILPPEKMPAQLLAYIEHAFDKLAAQAAAPLPETTNSLHKIFILLRNQTGHDFSFYKQNTIRRRIERRMTINQVERLADYVRYLQQNPVEIETLFKDLLIGVTNFFRDPEAFELLKTQVIPAIVAGKSATDPLRIWVPGCSTGEEAYSIAILFQEYLDELKANFKIQIFATDIDAGAIDKARLAVYPTSIAADVSPERLNQFFSQVDPETYRIKKSIRDLIIFAEQNVVEDPPFSKIDLISCRNLLIYMGPELQRKVVPLFHYVLNPEGFLFLGNSESIGEFNALFATVDKKWKVFRRTGDAMLRSTMANVPIPPLLRGAVDRASAPEKDRELKLNVRELVEQVLLEAYTLPCALITENGEVLFIHGRTGKYLEPASGEASLNILRMAREGIRVDLTTAIRRAITQKETVRADGLRVKGNGEVYTINLIIRPIAKPLGMPGLLMVLFEDVIPASQPISTAKGQAADATDQRIAELERELKAKEEHLRSALEEMETSNQELRSTNEELQSTNEELQSTNEELETSKEEMQSVNEELVTVNMELQKKVEELFRANNDINNLMAATAIGTIFVDSHLKIQRFTPASTEVINFIQSDVGRPVSHIVSNLVNYDSLPQDTRQVLKTLVPKEAEVQTQAGQWYLMRILPYRTLENVVEGAVITFVEITELKRLQETARNYQQLFEMMADAIFIGDRQGRFVECNDAVLRLYGYSREEFLGLSTADIVHPDNRWLLQSIQRRVLAGESVKIESVHRHKDGRDLSVETTVSRIEYQQQPALFTIVHAISDRKEAEKNLFPLAAIAANANDALIVQDFEGRILVWNPAAERVYGWSEAEALAMNIENIIPKDKRAEFNARLQQRVGDEVIEPFEIQRIARGGRVLEVRLTVTALLDAAGKPYAIATTEREVTERQA